MNNKSPIGDARLLQIMGERISQRRLQRNRSQAHLASEAGVSKRTLERVEAGGSIQLSNFIRILRALDLLDGLDALLPEPLPSPLQQLKLQGRQRQRASTVREPEAASEAWTWNDES
ncbi:MAG: helix-turn-helix domain-containing protein [Dokdonella sp.]